jgi:hypothetical protein
MSFAAAAAAAAAVVVVVVVVVVVILFINCNWVITRWQWLFYIYTNMSFQLHQ